MRLLGSGSIFNEALRASKILAEKYAVSSDVYSATSYKNLRLDALNADRHNSLHPDAPKQSCYLWDLTKDWKEPVIASSDYVRLVSEQIAPWIEDYTVLGTDGFGRSEGREELRRFFGVDAESIVHASLQRLEATGKLPKGTAAKALKELGLDATRKNPLKD